MYTFRGVVDSAHFSLHEKRSYPVNSPKNLFIYFF
jgi:hypothetical protein